MLIVKPWPPAKNITIAGILTNPKLWKPWKKPTNLEPANLEPAKLPTLNLEAANLEPWISCWSGNLESNTVM